MGSTQTLLPSWRLSNIPKNQAISFSGVVIGLKPVKRTWNGKHFPKLQRRVHSWKLVKYSPCFLSLESTCTLCCSPSRHMVHQTCHPEEIKRWQIREKFWEMHEICDSCSRSNFQVFIQSGRDILSLLLVELWGIKVWHWTRRCKSTTSNTLIKIWQQSNTATQWVTPTISAAAAAARHWQIWCNFKKVKSC